jgi:hypothetical protein
VRPRRQQRPDRSESPAKSSRDRRDRRTRRRGARRRGEDFRAARSGRRHPSPPLAAPRGSAAGWRERASVRSGLTRTNRRNGPVLRDKSGPGPARNADRSRLPTGGLPRFPRQLRFSRTRRRSRSTPECWAPPVRADFLDVPATVIVGAPRRPLEGRRLRGCTGFARAPVQTHCAHHRGGVCRRR